MTPTLDGPYRVRGPIEVSWGTGRTCKRTTEAYVCRFRGSSDKPYCDGNHAKIGFKAAGA